MTQIDRSNYLRVTSVLSPFTGIEFVPACYLDPAADRGTRAHSSIEAKIKGFGHSNDEDIQGYLKSFDDWWDVNSGDFKGEIIQEKRLYCDELEITGQVDMIVDHEDGTCIFDWKTSSKPQKSWELQGSAYRYLCRKNGFEFEDEDSVYFIHLKKDGSKASVIEYNFMDLTNAFHTFEKCLELYRYFDMSKTRGKKR